MQCLQRFYLTLFKEYFYREKLLVGSCLFLTVLVGKEGDPYTEYIALSVYVCLYVVFNPSVRTKLITSLV